MAACPPTKHTRPLLTGFWPASCWLLLFGLLLAPRPAAAEYRPLPPAWAAGLSDDWLLHDAAHNRLILYLPGYHAPAHAYYQWVRLRPGQPFPISFAAQPGLSLFLNNQFVFTARAATTYSLDLARLLPAAVPGRPVLLAVWQPDGSPLLSSFHSGSATAAAAYPAATNPLLALPRLPGQQGENVFLPFLLLLGLCYGGMRATYRPGLSRIFQVEELFGSAPDQQSFLTKPAFTLLNLLLVLLFAFSLALLLVAIHTNLQNLPLVRQFFDVPESAIVARVLVYALLIAGFVFGKYLFLELMGYIFDVQSLVNPALPRISAQHASGRAGSAGGGATLSGLQCHPPHSRQLGGECCRTGAAQWHRIARGSHPAPAHLPVYSSIVCLPLYN